MLDEPVPLVIRNAPTRLMKELHYGEGYQYAHDARAVSYTHLTEEETEDFPLILIHFGGGYLSRSLWS